MSLLIRLSLLCILSLSLPLIAENSIPVKSGETIAFLGDSITAAGAKPGGYCRLVIDGLKQEGIEVKSVFAGKSGHKSNQMLSRLERDVISKKPNWMTLSCGVNDVWHGKGGVNLEDYKVNIEKIIDKAQAAGIKVMLLTSTMIKEDQSNDLNKKLLPYNEALRELAKKKGCLLADLNQDMQEGLKTFPADAPKGKQLTSDGVHMNPYGNFMMAKGILKAFGVPEERVKEFEVSWKKIPNSKGMRFRLSMSLAEYEKIKEKTGKEPQAVFNEAIEAKKQELLK
jgi:lysophospholipase L1-like esterase